MVSIWTTCRFHSVRYRRDASSIGSSNGSGSPRIASKAKSRSRLKKIISGCIGPGVITGAADDDPSGITTYSIAGAKFGYDLLWTSLLTWPLAAAVQMLCARVGMVTGQGLAALLRKKFPFWFLFIISFALFLANTINIAADLSGMGDAFSMLTGFPSIIAIVLFAIFITAATLWFRYHTIVKILKWLTLTLAAYMITAIYLTESWSEVLKKTFQFTRPNDSDAWGCIVAILGTTISPYLFFWQASQEVEEEKSLGKKTIKARQRATALELDKRLVDVTLGTFISNLIMFFIILTTALTLYPNGIQQIASTKEAAEALKPIAGNLAYFLFTAGILGVGFLAIPTLAGSAAYAFAETFRFRQGLDEKPHKAKIFYFIIVLSSLFAVALDFLKVNPIQALFYSAVVNGLLAPVLLIALLIVASDEKLMLNQKSSLANRFLVGTTAAMMIAAAIYMFSSFSPQTDLR
jgi:NRAMP (natural resistance-associated macrophage protein)-like metal ion transporter